MEGKEDWVARVMDEILPEVSVVMECEEGVDGVWIG